VIALLLVGAAGRMGRAVEQAAAAAGDFEVMGRVDVPGSWPPGAQGWSADPASFAHGRAVVVEFSSPEGCRAAAVHCAARGLPLVSGTTGLPPEVEAGVTAAAARVPVLRAANFSLGIAALARALRAALGALPPEWDVEIVERHHRRKLDSPSGTALALASAARAQRGWPEGALRFGREGRAGPRPAAEIGVHAVRGGSWVGDHEVLLAGEGEWIELRHVATDRSAFAQGALAAARFVASARPGLYNLDDVLSAKGR
jgi:4-hydroxy-tetrahydrodipicolinate reductase